MGAKVFGVENLQLALKELTNMNSSEWKSALTSSVRIPINVVKKRATQNIARISPGKAPYHWTYKHRKVLAGFSARNIVATVHIHPENGIAIANLGVAPEAFYALQFFERGVPSMGIAKQPWLVPALESTQSEVVQLSTDALLNRINKIAAKHAAVQPTK